MNKRISIILSFANIVVAASAFGIPTIGYCAEAKTIIHDGARVKLIADDANGRLLIRIDGETAAFIDSNGLNVRKGLNYGDAFTDYGRAGFDGALKASRTSPDER